MHSKQKLEVQTAASVQAGEDPSMLARPSWFDRRGLRRFALGRNAVRGNRYPSGMVICHWVSRSLLLECYAEVSPPPSLLNVKMFLLFCVQHDFYVEYDTVR